jgi:hypothetical protein
MLDDFEMRMEVRDMVVKGLALIDRRAAEIFVDKALHDIQNKELGQEWGISGSRAQQLFHQASRRIRQKLRLIERKADIVRVSFHPDIIAKPAPPGTPRKNGYGYSYIPDPEPAWTPLSMKRICIIHGE